MTGSKVIDFRDRKFVQVTKDVLDKDTKLTKPVDIAVYTVLCMYADNQTKSSNPKLSTIADKSRCSESVARRALNNLQQAGYIEARKRADKYGRQTSNQYVLLDVGVENNRPGPSETRGWGCQF